MFSRKRMISLVVSCVLVTQILTSTMFSLSKIEAASLDGTSTQSVEESKESTRKGDVDGNGEVDSIDFARMRMVLLGIIGSFPVSNGTWAADVSGDGIFNSIDFAFVRQYILGFITKFPAETNSATPTPSFLVTPTPIDIEPPSKPIGLNSSSVTGTTVSIYWEPSTDSDVMDYAIYINGEFVVLTDGETEYTFTNLIPNETYEFKVCAIDASDNKSEFSDVCVITTKVSTIDEIKIALIHNFNQKGTTYSLTYDGDVTDLQTKVNQAVSDAVNESNEPFMLSDLSWSADGYIGNLQITFDFAYDDKNEYMMVARSTNDLKKALLLGFYNRTQDINIIYKGTITQSEINSAKESILSNDTYLNACIGSCEGTVVSNSLGINAIRLNCSYKTTKEQEAYIDSTVDFIVSKLTNVDMSDDEKEKLIHDYIVTNIDYCEEEKYGDAYSALYYGKTKCDGYAMLTYKMLKAAGIENIIVTNEDHAWNVVKTNDKWYHLDTTWDDAKKKDYGFYRYYNMTDEEILETRNYNNVYGIECTSNYIADLTERNTNSDGKYGEILKDFEQNDDYYFVNSFNSNASLTLLYNEVVLKELESISLIDDKIPTELYENSYQWSTSDPNVATVTNGIITAKKAGTVMISAQPMYDMLSTSSLLCKVHVVSVNSEDGKTQQVLSKENISGITDSGMQLQLTINSKDDIDSTTTVTSARDLLEGKIWFVGEPVNISTTSEFDWAEIGFKLSEEQIASYNINDLVIYWYDEETGTLVPQATTVNEESGVISATVTHFSPYVVAPRQISDLTTTLAFVIDSKYSNQSNLNTFKESICSTIAGLRMNSNVRAIFIDAKTNKTIRNKYYTSEGVYTGGAISNPKDDVDSVFKEITPGSMTPSNQEVLATVNSGMTNGNEELDKLNVSGYKNNKYILFYTKWDAFFADNNSIIKKMGDTIGLAIGNTVGYYAGGPISYKETDVNPLVAFLLEGNYTQVSLSNTNKTPWVLKLDGNNIENDVIVLQKMLVSLGLLKMPINPNTNTYVEFGTYGSLTVAAVKEFQENNGLYPDGKVGKNTWNKLSLPWDEENAQPDRNSWSYRYLLQNNKFYTENPVVTLITPTANTELERGESIKITAKGTNCHHLAVFINGEWKKTVFGDSNTNIINLEYDFVIPAVGRYNIQVKGRNIPGNSGVLVGSEIVEIEGTKEAFDLSFDNPDVWLTDQELITNLFKFKEYVRYNNGISFWELDYWQQDLIYEGIRFNSNTKTIDMLFNRLDALRSMNDVPYNPGGTTYIDEGTVQAVIIEEIKCQAAETWKKRIPVYLSALKTKILNLNTKYIEFISLTKDERKAIQYALKLYQTGELDHYTSIALDAIHVVNNIPYIEGHTWAITPEMMDAIIDMSNKRAANESINQTLTEISDFAEKYRLGEMFYSSVVLWAATRIPMGAAYDKAVAEAVSKLKYADDYAEHLMKVKGFDRNATKGITGGHNMDEFYNYFKNVEGLSDDFYFIEKIVPHPDPKFKGIYEITYKVPYKDPKTGNYIFPPSDYKIFTKPKTIYDPNVFSDVTMLKWGEEAMVDGIVNNTIEGYIITGKASNGLKFMGYIDTSVTDAIKIKNFFPIID